MDSYLTGYLGCYLRMAAYASPGVLHQAKIYLEMDLKSDMSMWTMAGLLVENGYMPLMLDFVSLYSIYTEVGLCIIVTRLCGRPKRDE